MTLTAADFVSVGHTLYAIKSEPEQRSAISRHYYGAYHRCNEWHAALPAPGHDIGPPGGAHQRFVNQLKNPDPSCDAAQQNKSRKLGMKLDIFRLRRRTADYELTATVPAADATAQRDQVVSLIAYCNQP